MLLLEKYVKLYLLAEDNDVVAEDNDVVAEESKDLDDMTYGDFIKALDLVSKEKSNIAKIKKNKSLGKVALKAALTLATWGGSEVINAALDASEAIKALTKQDDKSRPEGFLSQLDLDDKTTAILDDKIEDEFIEYVKTNFDKKQDELMPKNFDLNDELDEFLINYYKRKVTK